MFGAKHYVPILRWKQAERLALRYLDEKDRCRITPLIEITPKSFDAPKTGNKQGKKPDPAASVWKTKPNSFWKVGVTHDSSWISALSRIQSRR